jgi:hypothetical protein
MERTSMLCERVVVRSSGASKGVGGSPVWLSKAAARVMADKQKKGASKERRRDHAEMIHLAMNACLVYQAPLESPSSMGNGVVLNQVSP